MTEVRSDIQAGIDALRETPFEVRKELFLRAIEAARQAWNNPEEVEKRNEQARAVAAAAHEAGKMVLI